MLWNGFAKDGTASWIRPSSRILEDGIITSLSTLLRRYNPDDLRMFEIRYQQREKSGTTLKLHMLVHFLLPLLVLIDSGSRTTNRVITSWAKSLPCVPTGSNCLAWEDACTGSSKLEPPDRVWRASNGRVGNNQYATKYKVYKNCKPEDGVKVRF